ncbi:MAG TPA: hypothetical protein VKA06_11945 [Spirochaetia bacterium]|nr:hypothetical protein [Spirochaetia bacterium]
MNTQTLLRNAGVSIILGFILSVVFWVVWDVFVLSGFLIWSIASGAAGALLSGVLKRNLPAALLFTTIIRVAIFVLFSGLWF